MPFRTVLLALLTVFLNSAAQLLLRGAALRGATPANPIALAQSPFFLLALGAYGASVLTWLVVLKTVPLPTAMPFVAVVYVVVPLASYLFFRDALTYRMAGGMALVIAGILVVAGK